MRRAVTKDTCCAQRARRIVGGIYPSFSNSFQEGLHCLITRADRTLPTVFLNNLR